MIKKRILIITIILLTVLVLVGYIVLIGCSAEKRQVADLDRDGKPEIYSLYRHRVSVIDQGRTIWRSPPSWKVDSFHLADATNDGRTDLVLVVWKKGSFGPHKPFWITTRDNRISNHLFLFNLEAGKIHSLWMSSALDHPIYRLEIKDQNHDNRNELLVSENPLVKMPFIPARAFHTTMWQWKTWGFFRID